MPIFHTSENKKSPVSSVGKFILNICSVFPKPPVQKAGVNATLIFLPELPRMSTRLMHNTVWGTPRNACKEQDICGDHCWILQEFMVLLGKCNE